MNKYLDILKQKTKGQDDLSPVLEKRQLLLNTIDRKVTKTARMVILGIVMVGVTDLLFLILNHFSPTAFELMAGYVAALLGMVFVSCLFTSCWVDSNTWRAKNKEHRALRALDAQFFKDLSANHTLVQELSQWVVDAKSEQAFNEILVNINTQNDDETVAKILKLLDAYDAHTRLSQNNEKNKALHRDFGVHIVPVQEPHRLAEML